MCECGQSHTKKHPLEYTTTTGPTFKLDGEVLDSQPSKKAASGLLVVAELRAGKAKAVLAPRGRAPRMALELAEETGNPVVVAEIVDTSGGLSGAVLRRVGMVWTAKADPLSTEGFDLWAAQLAAELAAIAVAETPGVMTGVMDLLDFDFAAAGDAQIDALQIELASRLAVPPATLARAQQIVLRERLAGVIRSVGGAMARQPGIRGTIGAGLSLPDRELGSLMSRFHSFFVRDQYGNVSTSLGRQAAGVINRGLASGLGRVELGRELQSTIRGGLEMKGYWQTVASNAVGHARSYTQGASMRAAGIENFRIVAVLDDNTTDICLYLDGKIVSVGGAMAMMDRQLTAETPEEFMDAHPLARQSGDRVYHRYSDGREVDLLRVVTPGEYGRPGSYAPSSPSGDLVDAAIGLAPYHHNCRSTFVAV